MVADAFSRLCERRPSFDADTDDKAGPFPDVLASMGDINPPPVTTEPSIPPPLRAKIEAVHNSTSGHFGVKYTRKGLLGKGVSDDGLRQHVAKFVRDVLYVSYDRLLIGKSRHIVSPRLRILQWKS